MALRKRRESVVETPPLTAPKPDAARQTRVEKNKAAIQLLDAWLAAPLDPDAQRNWADVKAIIEENRLSDRPLLLP